MILAAFLLSLAAFLFQILATGPSLPILPFIPLLALTALKRSLPKTLYLLFGCGLLTDLASSSPFGIYALCYTFTALFCFRWRTRFSADAPLQFSLYSALCSFVFTLLLTVLLFLFDRRVLFEGKWWLTEWPLLPFFDGIYAFLWFAGPLMALRAAKRRLVIYWLKRKNPSLN